MGTSVEPLVQLRREHLRLLSGAREAVVTALAARRNGAGDLVPCMERRARVVIAALPLLAREHGGQALLAALEAGECPPLPPPPPLMRECPDCGDEFRVGSSFTHHRRRRCGAATGHHRKNGTS